VNGGTPHSGSLICGRCSTVCDDGDKYCRECGMSLQDEELPIVAENRLPVEWRPSVPAAVAGGAALVAVGTVARFLLGHMARGAYRAAFSSHPRPASQARGDLVITEPPPSNGNTDLVSETFFFRRVRIRH
jgi:hypothetical protein